METSAVKHRPVLFVNMDRLRSRLKRGWNLQSFLKKQPTWLWKCWLLMVLALFLMVQGRQGIWTTRLTEADDHREEGGGRGEIVVGHKVEEEGGAPPRAEQSSTKKHSDASRVQPVVDQTVDIIDNLVKQSGSDTIMKNYLMVKSMMKLYNPEASKWAQRASAKYRWVNSFKKCESLGKLVAVVVEVIIRVGVRSCRQNKLLLLFVLLS